MNVCLLEEKLTPIRPPISLKTTKIASNSYLYPGTVYIHFTPPFLITYIPYKFHTFTQNNTKTKTKQTMAFNTMIKYFRSPKCKRECMISYTLKNKLNDEKYNPFIKTLYHTNKLYLIHFKFIFRLKIQHFSTPDLFL